MCITKRGLDDSQTKAGPKRFQTLARLAPPDLPPDLSVLPFAHNYHHPPSFEHVVGQTKWSYLPGNSEAEDGLEKSFPDQTPQ